MSITDDPLDYIAMIEHARQLERRFNSATNRVQTILDEGFGPQPVDTIENNLSLLEQKIYETRAELARLTDILDKMYEANKLIQSERDYAKQKAENTMEAYTQLAAENRRLESKLEELRLAYNEVIAEPPLKIKLRKRE